MKPGNVYAVARGGAARAALAVLCAFACPPAPSTDAARAPQNSSALPRAAEVVRKGLESNNYLGPLLELRAREAEYLASPRLRSGYLQYMSYLTGWVGEYEESYRYEETFLADIEPQSRLRKNFAKELDSSPIDGYSPRKALDAVASVADRQQVIIINEEHRTPLHRAFTLRLLPLLYARGFRYLAVEDLDETDAGLNSRGYPVQRSGTYVADPVFGQLIRDALKLGFKVVPYDNPDPGCQPKPDNPMSCDDARERGQAQNIYDRILKSDPRAKILVHSGRDHNAEENEGEGFAYMGWHFRQVSGIDPFTVDQMHLSPRRNPADEEPLYRYVTRKGLVSEPTVFASGAGRFWNEGSKHDMKIFHPRVRYERGRPVWLGLGGLRAPHAIDLWRLKLRARGGGLAAREPMLVQAFVKGESADAVPVDQLVLYPGKEVPPLMLPAGAFKVRAVDARGGVAGEYEARVKPPRR
jgi:hypothetical protein